ncbi:MAG: shikimate dehydrogenase [Proteobacteria bacterium]|nr:shikimate dehydrogenase [Pseudomonadota bacterium]
MDLYGVMGNPIEHSRSPKIHALFAEQTRQDITYEKIFVPINGFKEAVEQFKQRGGKGLNVTLPFKQDAFDLADSTSEFAKQAGAVNTLTINPSGEIVGENTDGIGLVRDLLVNQKIKIQDKAILLIGAGGAARGVIGPLLKQQPTLLHVTNRTEEKAHELKFLFHQFGSISSSGLSDIPNIKFDIVINATSASLNQNIPAISPTLISPHCFFYDMVYGNELTLFLQWVKGLGAQHYVDGKGMLLEQAAESFFIWRGVRPNTALIKDKVFE